MSQNQSGRAADILEDSNEGIARRVFKKWDFMTERGLERFMDAHPSTFGRRMRRGIPQHYRWNVWKIVTGTGMGGERDEHPGLYKHLANTPSSNATLIRIDIPRTFPEYHSVFDDEKQEMLYRMLNAYANRNPAVGYCQGMNFVAGIVLLVSDFEEEDAWWVLVSLMEAYELQGFYLEKFPLLRRYMRAYESLSERHIPELRGHFARQAIPASTYLHQWYLTMFVSCLPIKTVVVLWDAILADGLPELLRLSISILHVLSVFLIRMQFEEVLKFFKTLRYSDENSTRVGRWLVREAGKILIPADVLAAVDRLDLSELMAEAAEEEAIEAHKFREEKALHYSGRDRRSSDGSDGESSHSDSENRSRVRRKERNLTDGQGSNKQRNIPIAQSSDSVTPSSRITMNPTDRQLRSDDDDGISALAEGKDEAKAGKDGAICLHTAPVQPAQSQSDETGGDLKCLDSNVEVQLTKHGTSTGTTCIQNAAKQWK